MKRLKRILQRIVPPPRGPVTLRQAVPLIGFLLALRRRLRRPRPQRPRPLRAAGDARHYGRLRLGLVDVACRLLRPAAEAGDNCAS